MRGSTPGRGQFIRPHVGPLGHGPSHRGERPFEKLPRALTSFSELEGWRENQLWARCSEPDRLETRAEASGRSGLSRGCHASFGSLEGPPPDIDAPTAPPWPSTRAVTRDGPRRVDLSLSVAHSTPRRPQSRAMGLHSEGRVFYLRPPRPPYPSALFPRTLA